MATCLVLTLSALLSICASGQTTERIPFTATNIRSIIGRNICEFQGEFPEQFGVYLDGRKENSVHYQQRDGIIAVFLLSKPTGRCGVADAALDLTPLIRKGETVEFKCYTAHEGGTTWAKWGHVIGLADNGNGLKRFVRARLAWRVDVKEKRFDELKGQSVTCDTGGYTN
jgi:hypothetical protein